MRQSNVPLSACEAGLFLLQWNVGLVYRGVVGLKLRRNWDEAVATCVDYYEADKDRIPYTLSLNRGTPRRIPFSGSRSSG